MGMIEKPMEQPTTPDTEQVEDNPEVTDPGEADATKDTPVAPKTED